MIVKYKGKYYEMKETSVHDEKWVKELDADDTIAGALWGALILTIMFNGACAAYRFAN